MASFPSDINSSAAAPTLDMLIERMQKSADDASSTTKPPLAWTTRLVFNNALSLTREYEPESMRKRIHIVVLVNGRQLRDLLRPRVGRDLAAELPL